MRSGCEKCKVKCRRYKRKRSMPGFANLCGSYQRIQQGEGTKAWNKSTVRYQAGKASI